MGKRILLLGLGMQGKAVLHDLANRTDISRIVVVDNRADLTDHLRHYPTGKIVGCHLDVADGSSVVPLIQDSDVVIECLPSIHTLAMGKLAVDCGVSLVSSMYYLSPGEQDPETINSIRRQIGQLNDRAKEKGVVVLTEFGLDPGLDLILGARALKELDEVEQFNTYGAGIPAPNARTNALQYKFSWSIIGVMKAYRRPARIITAGRAVTLESGKVFEPGNFHILDLAEIGAPLECFPNGDSVPYARMFGIHDTVREMGRYTCRLPGHCAFWNIMSKCGFLDEKPAGVGGIQVSPIEFTAALLGSQEQFHYARNEQDMAFIRIDVRGNSGGKKTRIVYQLIDTRDLETGLTAMQRTVGFTLSIGARLILEGKLRNPGVLTALDVPYEMVIPALERYGLHVVRQEESAG
jgi:lysine 6-dehydrogenase